MSLIHNILQTCTDVRMRRTNYKSDSQKTSRQCVISHSVIPDVHQMTFQAIIVYDFAKTGDLAGSLFTLTMSKDNIRHG